MDESAPDTADQPESASEAESPPAEQYENDDGPVPEIPAKPKRGQPKKPKSEHKKSAGFRIAPDVLAGLKALAAERGCSQSDLIEAWYRADQGEQPPLVPLEVQGDSLPLRDDTRRMLEAMAEHRQMAPAELLDIIVQREQKRFDQFG